MTDMPATRRLGEGYEPHVDEVDGRLIYSLPIDSGLASFSRSFAITPDDLSALCRDRYRRAALYMTLHTVLQNAGRGHRPAFTDDAFRVMATRILFGSPEDVRGCIAAVDAEYNAGLDHYIAKAMAWQSPAG